MSDHSQQARAIDQSYQYSKRIKKRKDYLFTQESGRKWSTTHFLLSATPAKSSNSRLGVTVTRKASKKAVLRNKLKRRIREVFRRLYSYILEPHDIVVIAKNGATECSYKEIKYELNYALRRLSLLNNKKK